MTIDEWISAPAPKSVWRRRARGTMITAVVAYRNHMRDMLRPEPDRSDLLAAANRAYPFGQKKNHPYKAWLQEISILRDVLDPPANLKHPTQDEYHACEVANDLVEMGRILDAGRLLAEQAPNRLGRPCPVCKAKPGRMCTDKRMLRQVPHLIRVGSEPMLVLRPT